MQQNISKVEHSYAVFHPKKCAQYNVNTFVAIVPIAQGRTEPEVFVGLYDDNYIVRTRIPKNDGTNDTEPKYLFNYTRFGEPSVYDVTVVADSKINACNGYYKKTEVNHGLWGINTLLEDKVSMEK